MGAVSEKDYRGLVSSHLLKNNNVSPAAVSNARTLFGPDLANVRGKTVRIKPDPVVENYVAIPRDFVLANKHLTLAADVFFVDGIPLLLTISRRIKFVTSEHCPVRTAVALSNHVKKVLRVYNRAGFTVRYVLMDGEFEKVKAELPTIVCNTTAAKEHVAEAERQIRTVKERSRGIRATLPFSSIPKRVKIELVYFIVFWLNAFPVKSGISHKFSPRELVLRWQLDINIRVCQKSHNGYMKNGYLLDP